MSKAEVRYTADLININERERDIIISWAVACMHEWGLDTDEQDLMKRFTEWKEMRNNARQRT